MATSGSSNEAYLEGYDAYFNGCLEEDNPYKLMGWKECSRTWMDGFIDAMCSYTEPEERNE